MNRRKPVLLVAAHDNEIAVVLLGSDHDLPMGRASPYIRGIFHIREVEVPQELLEVGMHQVRWCCGSRAATVSFTAATMNLSGIAVAT